MLKTLRNVFNDSADLLIGGLAGTSIYSAFSHAATEHEMVGAVILTVGMAALVGSQVWHNKIRREIGGIRR